jgi:hypothetical protein
MLTKELCNSIFEYKDGNLYWKSRSDLPKKWNTKFVGKKAGWENGDGYISVSVYNKKYRLHRVIFLMHYGYLPEQIDHINNNRKDNRIENLRATTADGNNKNSLIASHNTSGIKGVSYVAKRNYWRCVLTTNKKYKEVCGFKTKELAQEFIELWRELAHGKFANHGVLGQAVSPV